MPSLCKFPPLSTACRTMADIQLPSAAVRENSKEAVPDIADASSATGANLQPPSITITGREDSKHADGRRQQGVWFRVSDSVLLALHRGDITTWFVDGKTDAIVNAANTRMLGGGGVDGAIHYKAGPKLKEACKLIPEVRQGVRCPTGEARVTEAFKLPVSHVVHTVGPIYHEYDDPEELLRNSYRNSLKGAIEVGMKYIAFPAISCGIYGYPIDEAAEVSLSVIKEVSEGLLEVHFVLFEQKTYFGWVEEAEKQFTKM